MTEALLVLTNYCEGYSDWPSILKLRCSLLPLERYGVNICTILCVQSSASKVVVPDAVRSQFNDVIYSNNLSISCARNCLLRHCYNYFSLESYVLFLDDDCYMTSDAGAALIRWMLTGRSDILMGRPPWGIPMPFWKKRTIGIGWLWQAYVWSTVFRLKSLRFHEFDESMGPGTGSPYQSGEDFLFMLSIIRLRKFSSVKFDDRFIVGHPDIGNAYERKTRYSRGHAYALFRALSTLDSLYMRITILILMTVFLFRPTLHYFIRGDCLALKLARHRLGSILREI